jgi:Xaa-Pro aminopeptidase
LRKLDPQRIAVNYSVDDVTADGLTHGMYLLLRQHLEGTLYGERLVSAGEIINALRGRKTRTEIAHIRKAIELAEEIFDEAGDFATLGKTEAEIARFMHERTEARGLGLAWDPQGCPIVNAGPGSMVGHGLPSELAIKPGQLFHIDFGVRYEGYCSDLQRMWYVPRAGENAPPDDIQRAFDTVVEAIQRSAAAIKPGVMGWEIDAIARQVVTDAGYPEFMHGLGHSVGRSAHDGGTGLLPRWEKYGQTPFGRLEAGNVFTIEPSILDVAGCGCLGLEEMVIVTETGCEFLSSPQVEIRMLG